jgi:hypothetical protein
VSKKPSAIELAKRASREFASALRAIEQANALLGVIRMLASDGDPAQISLIAQIGEEMTGIYAEAAGYESEYFEEVSNG